MLAPKVTFLIATRKIVEVRNKLIHLVINLFIIVIMTFPPQVC